MRISTPDRLNNAEFVTKKSGTETDRTFPARLAVVVCALIVCWAYPAHAAKEGNRAAEEFLAAGSSGDYKAAWGAMAPEYQSLFSEKALESAWQALNAAFGQPSGYTIEGRREMGGQSYTSARLRFDVRSVGTALLSAPDGLVAAWILDTTSAAYLLDPSPYGGTERAEKVRETHLAMGEINVHLTYPLGQTNCPAVVFVADPGMEEIDREALRYLAEALVHLGIAAADFHWPGPPVGRRVMGDPREKNFKALKTIVEGVRNLKQEWKLPVDPSKVFIFWAGGGDSAGASAREMDALVAGHVFNDGERQKGAIASEEPPSGKPAIHLRRVKRPETRPEESNTPLNEVDDVPSIELDGAEIMPPPFHDPAYALMEVDDYSANVPDIVAFVRGLPVSMERSGTNYGQALYGIMVPEKFLPFQQEYLLQRAPLHLTPTSPPDAVGHYSAVSVYLPGSLEECMVELDAIMDAHQKVEFKAMPEGKAVLNAYFGLGSRICPSWGVQGGSRLAAFFEGLGISVDDYRVMVGGSDRCEIVMTLFHRHLNGIPLRIKALLRRYRQYRGVLFRCSCCGGEEGHNRVALTGD